MTPKRLGCFAVLEENLKKTSAVLQALEDQWSSAEGILLHKLA
jgi:hypothetical protein